MTSKQHAVKIMNHLFGSRYRTAWPGSGWDTNSPAHKWWARWAKKNIRKLNKLTTREKYKLVDRAYEESK